MAEVIKMPRMSDTMTEGVIISWNKKVGDKVKPGDVLAEIETDKAVMEFESFQEGVLLYIGAEKGQAVPVDSVIAVLGKEGEDYKAALEQAGGSSKQTAAPKQEQPAQEKQKPEVEKQANAAPVTPHKTNGQSQQQPTQAPAQQRDVTAPTQRQPQTTTQQSDSRLKASPLAKRIARDNNIELTQVEGSGDEGRIVRRDVESLLKKGVSTTIPQRQTVTTGDYEDVPLSQMRKTIARRLSESKFTAPHFYLTIEIHMDLAMHARKQMIEASGEKISVNDLVIKAAALSLRRHPNVNCSWLGDKMRYYNYVNIGMAVAIEDGLVVPVIRDADKKSLTEISKEAKSFAQRAKERKLQPQDWEGNTFSISNLGMMDIEEFTAIINPPDACIMAVGKVKETVLVEDGEIKVGQLMKVTLSCDHRAVDGATGAKFLQTFKAFLENPVLMLV